MLMNGRILCLITIFCSGTMLRALISNSRSDVRGIISGA